MSKKSTILSDATIYTSLSILTQLLTLVTGILTRRFLGPVQMGVWSLLQIILGYSAYSTLGVSESISREIPFYQAKGEHEKAERMKNVIISFALFTVAIFSAGLAVWAYFKRADLSREIFYGLLIMSGMMVLQRISNLHIAFLRAYKFFTFAGKQMVISSIANAAFVVFFAYRFQMYGFMWAMCLSFIFNILYIRWYHRFTFRWNLNWPMVWEMMKYGFPLIITGLLDSFFISIDKLMIAKFLGLRELGVYSLAIMAYSYISTIPNSVGIVLIPNFHEKFGKTEDPKMLKEYLSKSTRAFSDLMPVLIAGVWCFAPFLAYHVLPDFRESIAPMKVLVLSAFYLALSHPYQYFLAVIRRQKVVVPIIAVACLFSFGTNYVALKGGWGLMGVSFATVIVAWIKFTGIYAVSVGPVFSRSESIKTYLFFIFKFIYVVCLFIFIEYLLPRAEESLWKVLLQFGMFAAGFLPFLIKLNRDFNLLTALKNKFSPAVSVQEDKFEASKS